MKITRVKAYLPPNPNPHFNQSNIVVTVETDTGIVGVGEGGSKDLLEQAAGRLIGRDPQHIEHLWQDMNRAFFYPAGRERTDAIGALDLALWDIKGKVQNQPIHELLGGMVRNYCACYSYNRGESFQACPSRNAHGPPLKLAIALSASVGWVFSAFLIGYAAFQVPAGLLVHKFGTRLVLSVAALWWGLFTVLTAVMPPRLCRCASQAQLCCHHSCARPLRTRRRRSNNVSGNQSIRRTLVSDARTRKSQRHHLRWSWCRIRPYSPNRDRNCRALRLAGVFLVQRGSWSHCGNRLVSHGKRYP